MFLGICDGHDSGAALVDERGDVVFAVSEERLSRKKRQQGFPYRSVEACLATGATVAAVGVAERAGRLPFRLLDSIYRRSNPDVGPEGIASSSAASYSALAARRFPRPEAAASALLLRRRLRSFGLRRPLSLVDHHRCHARTAAAELDHSLVLTLDAFGDGLSGSVHRGSADGQLQLLTAFPAPRGPALLFAWITRYLGFAEGEEGKVVARAAAGDPRALRPLFSAVLAWNGSGFTSSLDHPALLEGLRGHDPDDIAAALQERCEQLVAQLLADLLERHGGRHLALAGGLFANVALNRIASEVARRHGIETVFVFPAMGDAGLCVGAAMELAVRAGVQPRALRDPRLGPGPGSTDGAGIPLVRDAATQGGGMDPRTRAEIVGALTAGRLVASCRGRMEFGPRALGARSLLLSPADRTAARELNRALSRDPRMPFGPVMTAEAAPQLIQGWDRLSRDMTQVMTLALPASDRLRELAPAAVHGDGTARAQVVTAEFDPQLHSVLRELPGQVCINTSLNLHGEPIVATAAQAARSAGRAGAALLWLD